MAQNRNREKQVIRWSVYDDGLRLWVDGQHIGTIPTDELLHLSHQALELLRFTYGVGAAEQKKPTIKRGLGGQLRQEET